MKIKVKFNTAILLLISFFSTHIFSQSEEIEMKNSDLERLNREGNFIWWQNNQKFNGVADFLVERKDVNNGSTKALKVNVKKLADKGWGVSS